MTRDINKMIYVNIFLNLSLLELEESDAEVFCKACSSVLRLFPVGSCLGSFCCRLGKPELPIIETFALMLDFTLQLKF